MFYARVKTHRKPSDGMKNSKRKKINQSFKEKNPNIWCKKNAKDKKPKKGEGKKLQKKLEKYEN